MTAGSLHGPATHQGNDHTAHFFIKLHESRFLRKSEHRRLPGGRVQVQSTRLQIGAISFLNDGPGLVQPAHNFLR
jgi:hypothetical protein